MNRFALVFATALSALPASADPIPNALTAEYETSDINELSIERAQALRQGRGTGMAVAAERNGYPGPMQMLELADTLRLTDAQRIAAEDSFERMRGETRTLGEAIITAERALDQLFASDSATVVQVTQLTETIASAEGQLRAVHLNAHVEMARVLRADQMADYRRLRG